ncbi:hypothetical protein [Chitinophaga sp. YR627]|uniref:hypothetical protein n=1 Tax=Chitinophaga sp. YR627 TaxID=1881041 RepID=UPI001160DA70|nr:hypothetical protein [Chitinophaga sp. YR627]
MVNLVVDTTSFQEVGDDDYRVNIYMVGFYNNDKVELYRGSVKISSCIATTFSDEFINEPFAKCKDFRLVIGRRKNRQYKIIFNGEKIAVPLVYGYGILTIEINYDRVKRTVLKSKFTYSNRILPKHF